MKLISHRGNLNGRIVEKENTIESILSAIDLGFDVEIDIWRENYGLYLGHDNPQYNISIDWLIKNANYLWIHCKNDKALFYLNQFDELNIFFHRDDEFTISSKKQILINPSYSTFLRNGILMMPELSKYNQEDIYKFDGIITDNIISYK